MAKSIIGFHYSIHGGKEGTREFMDGLNQVGIPFLVKGTDDTGLIVQAKEYSDAHKETGVENWLIYRVSTEGQANGVEYNVPDYNKSPKDAAQEHWEKTIAKWPPDLSKPNLNKAHVWMEPINEPRGKLYKNVTQYKDMHPVNWLGEFMYEYALIANGNGFKVCGPSFNSGEPGDDGKGLQDAVRQYSQPGMIKYLRYCAENPEKAALAVHEYIWELWETGSWHKNWYPYRFGRLEAAIAAADNHHIPRTFPIFVTEWGFEAGRAPRWTRGNATNVAKNILTQYNQWAARWPQLKGVAAWALQYYNVGNATVNQDLLTWIDKDQADNLTRYAVTHEFPSGDQPARTHERFGSTLPNEIFKDDKEQKIPESLAAIQFKNWPTDYYTVLEDFGTADALLYADTGGLHEGIDIKAPFGSPYYAVAAGEVIKASNKTSSGLPSPFGWHIIIDHGDNCTTLYAHADKELKVTEGDKVQAGDVIGYSGSTGNTSSDFLHFSLKAPENGDDANVPLKYWDPWLILAPLHEEPEPPKGDTISGWLYGKNVLKKTNGVAIVAATANMRQEPHREATLIRTVQPGETAYIEDEDRFENGYYFATVRKRKQAAEGEEGGLIAVVPDGTSGAQAEAITTSVTEEFQFQTWPTDYLLVSQGYCNHNPQFYAAVGGYHEGIDLRAPFGSPYYAVANGKVIWVSNKKRSNPNQTSNYGWHVILDHGQGISTLYAHAQENIPVAVGETVRAGTIIAYSGKTGQATAAHLHLTVKKIGASDNCNTPPNYVDPWIYLRDLFEKPDPPRGETISGWLWGKDLLLKENGVAITTIRANLRHQPFVADETFIRTVQPGEVAKLDGRKENGYCWATVKKGKDPEIIVTSSQVSTMLGLHLTADGGVGPGWDQPMREELQTLAPTVLKFMSSHDRQMVSTIVADNKPTVQKYIVRAFLNWGGRNISVQKFCDGTLSDTKDVVNRIKAHGVRDKNIIVELHNEPNLMSEGQTFSWQNGKECVAFFAQVLDIYRQEMPGVLFGLGALSPGGDIPDVRRDASTFLAEMMTHARWKDFDVHLVHLYTSTGKWESVANWLDHCQAATPGMAIWITESSWHTSDNTSGEAYAATLNKLMQLLDNRPVKGITFYCASASDPRYYHEVWCRSSDKNNPFMQVTSRGIAKRLRALRPRDF